MARSILFAALALPVLGQNVPLTPGVASQGVAVPGTTSLFSISTPLTSTSQSLTLDLYLNLTARDCLPAPPGCASVKLFASISRAMPQPPGPTSAVYTITAQPGSNSLTIQFADPLFQAAGVCPINPPGGTCNFYLGVAGLGQPAALAQPFSLTATPGNTTANLTDSRPVYRNLAPGGVATFAYTPIYSNNVSFVVTFISGGGALFASTTVAAPGPGASTWSASGTDVLVIAVQASDPNYNPPAAPPFPVFYLSVYASATDAASYFSIVATTQAGNVFAQNLGDGAPTGGVVAAGAMSYFTLNLWAFAGVLPGGFDVAVAGDTGASVDVFVQPCTAASCAWPQPLCVVYDPDSGSCRTWSAVPGTFAYTSQGSAQTGYTFAPPGTFSAPFPTLNIAVISSRGGDGGRGPPPGPSVFTLTASSGGRMTFLQAGTPLPSRVRRASAADGTKYFAYAPQTAGADVLVTADVASGSMDLFAKEFNLANPPSPGVAPAGLPGPASNTWNSTAQVGMQSKVLRIPWTSLSTSCQMSINFGLGNCGIAVAAVGNAALLGAATFSIAAAQAGSPLSPWQLTIGTEALIYVPSGGCDYLLATPPSTGQSFFSTFIYVQNQFGSSTLYVNQRTQSFWQPGKGLFPDWMAPDQGGFELYQGAHNASRDSTTGPYYVTVCANPGSDVQATVAFNRGGGRSIVPLDSGVRTAGYAECFRGALCEPALFSFSVTDPSATVSFRVDRDSSSETVYISYMMPAQPWVTPSPRYYNYTWFPTFFNPVFMLPNPDPGCVPKDTSPCVYYIGVVPTENLAASYFITATAAPAGGNPITQLYDGATTSGQVMEGSSNCAS